MFDLSSLVLFPRAESHLLVLFAPEFRARSLVPRWELPAVVVHGREHDAIVVALVGLVLAAAVLGVR